MTRVSSTHHVLCLEHLAGDFGYGVRAEDLISSSGERREAGHVEVQSREWSQISRHFSQVTIELAWEAQ